MPGPVDSLGHCVCVRQPALGERGRDILGDLAEILAPSALDLLAVALSADERAQVDEARPRESELLRRSGDPSADLSHGLTYIVELDNERVDARVVARRASNHVHIVARQFGRVCHDVVPDPRPLSELVAVSH